MAKKKSTRGRRPKSEVNRSEKIRGYLNQNPKATNPEIKQALASEGIDVSDNLISGVRRRTGISSPRRRQKKTGRKGTGRKDMGRKGPGRAKTGRGKLRRQVDDSSPDSPAKTGDEVSVTALLAAGEFVVEVGGIEKARRLLDVLASCQVKQGTR